jgi:hypothetical protein
VLEKIQGWGDVGGGATAIGVFIAGVAAFFTYGQYRGARQIQREATAAQIYSKYLELAVLYPELANGVRPTTLPERERYEWFVSYMLNACEQIWGATINDPIWQSCVEGQLAFHQNHLCTDRRFLGIERSYYSPELQMVSAKLSRKEPPGKV